MAGAALWPGRRLTPIVNPTRTCCPGVPSRSPLPFTQATSVGGDSASTATALSATTAAGVGGAKAAAGAKVIAATDALAPSHSRALACSHAYGIFLASASVSLSPSPSPSPAPRLPLPPKPARPPRRLQAPKHSPCQVGHWLSAATVRLLYALALTRVLGRQPPVWGGRLTGSQQRTSCRNAKGSIAWHVMVRVCTARHQVHPSPPPSHWRVGKSCREMVTSEI